MLNVYFGGTLTQDLIFHAQSATRWATAHKVYRKLFVDGTIDTIGKNHMEVNSHHHQGVTIEDLSPELDGLLYAENEDEVLTGSKGIVEAFKHKTLPIFGLQWHPEQLYDQFSVAIMNGLLSEREKATR